MADVAASVVGEESDRLGDHGKEGEEGWSWGDSACGHALEGAGVVGTGCDRSSPPGHLAYQSPGHLSSPESPGHGLAVTGEEEVVEEKARHRQRTFRDCRYFVPDGDPGRRRGRPSLQPSIAMQRFGEYKPCWLSINLSVSKLKLKWEMQMKDGATWKQDLGVLSKHKHKHKYINKLV